MVLSYHTCIKLDMRLELRGNSYSRLLLPKLLNDDPMMCVKGTSITPPIVENDLTVISNNNSIQL